MGTEKLIIYCDMDDCLADYNGGYLASKSQFPDIAFPQSIPGFFRSLKPLPGAVETFHWLSRNSIFDTYILSAPSLKNPLSYSEKRIWVEENLGEEFIDRLIISSYKNLNYGHYLIDDYDSGKGQELFGGMLIKFGTGQFPDWNSVKLYFENVASRVS
ncbi:hypothetical protein A3735_15010 [Oleiphilus sp. HI0061]|uniref:5' nucleotidase, NT5C type n=1 Tax=Oleiphilus sp. HI0061 TaxID=1822239 RepID=UPI0007CF80C5|nr:hypothetical protein [Oleiphilus sp. HI0061]KZY59553.1 hypothetical protein A3735_15010 [Oleiphilus sp. HI0061]